MAAEAEADREISNAAMHGNAELLVKICTEREFQSAANNIDYPYYAVQLLAYLALNDLDNARFLWKRAPECAKSPGSTLDVAWTAGKCMWRSHFSDAYASLRELEGAELESKLARATAMALRRRVARTIAMTYECISVEECTRRLGAQSQDVVEILDTEGLGRWTVSDDGMWIRRLEVPPTRVEQVSSAAKGIQELTGQIVRLQMP